MGQYSMMTQEFRVWPAKTGENFLLFNLKTQKDQQSRYFQAFQTYLKDVSEKNIFGLLTSGTSAIKAEDFKIVMLRRDALEASAKAVNEWIDATAMDRWSLSLPSFHVGGLSILARAFLSQSEVIAYGDMKWDPEAFCQHLQQEKITLVSLVPTQIHDLVQHHLSCPSTLRCVFVGGGELRSDLWARAKALGWPMIMTFGMTEMSSQVACSRIEDPERSLYLLPHIEARLNVDRKLQLRSPAQLSGLIEMNAGQLRIQNIQEQDWFQTEDFAELHILIGGTRVVPLGRGSDFVKVKGENVSLKKLRDLWSQLVPIAEQSYLLAKPDTRDGFQIYVVVAGGITEAWQSAQTQFNAKVLPFERIQKLIEIPEIPRSDLGKVLVSKILEMIK